MKKFIFIILAILITGSNIYAQVVEQEYYDLEIPCTVKSKKDFIINNSSDAWRALDCNLSHLDFYKHTIIGLVRSTCGDNGKIIIKIFRDDKNKKYIIKSRFQNVCGCYKLRHRPEIRIVYTKKLKENYEIEFDYLKPSS